MITVWQLSVIYIKSSYNDEFWFMSLPKKREKLKIFWIPTKLLGPVQFEKYAVQIKWSENPDIIQT